LIKAGGDAILAMTRKEVKTPSSDGWVYQMNSEQSERASSASSQDAGSHVVFGSENNLTTTLQSQLTVAKQTCIVVKQGASYGLDPISNTVTLDMGDRSHIQMLLKDDMWNYVPALSSITFVSDLQAPMLSPLKTALAVVQELAKMKSFPRLLVMTQGELDLNGGSLRGFFRSLRKEQPQFKAVLVDTDPVSHNEACAEIFPCDSETEVSYRAGARHVARLAKSVLVHTL
jgi:hypothetical protein